MQNKALHDEIIYNLCLQSAIGNGKKKSEIAFR